MEESGKPYRNKRIRIGFIIGTLFLAGLLLFFLSERESRNALYEEHDRHMGDIALYLDRGIQTVFSRCRENLSAVAGSKILKEVKTQYDLDGDRAKLSDTLSETGILSLGYADRVLVRYGREVLYSTDPTDKLQYTFFAGIGKDALWVCVDNITGENYIGLVSESRDSGFTCIMLMTLKKLYDWVVLKETNETYWVVLYDPQSGLVLQNGEDLPRFRFYSVEELKKRGDGLSLIQAYESRNESGSDNYSYIDGKGERTDNRIYVIPTKMTGNGILAIGIAIRERLIYMTTPLPTLGAVFLISFSLSVAVYYLVHSRRREHELTGKLRNLEKEKKLTESLLQQREKLAHHQKLETIGTLTAGIAHEFNNLLSPIMADSLLILENSTPEDPDIYDNAIEIYEASHKAKQLISRISKLSRKNSAAELQPIFPSALLDGVRSMMISSVPKNITVEKLVDSDRMILGNETSLEHMFINLIVNAIHAIDGKEGKITIRVWDEEENVVFSVKDTGPGIAKKDLPNLFEPFYTSKESGKGTGLGLPIAQQTVNEHGGTIMAENDPAGGAVFTVRIPAFRQQDRGPSDS